MTTIEVKVPDIGDFKEVEVIEVLVKPGDRVAVEQSLITVESDKASMEIPSSAAGVVTALKVKLGDKVSEGSPLVELEADDSAAAPAKAEAEEAASLPEAMPAAQQATPEGAAAPAPVAPAPAASVQMRAPPPAAHLAANGEGVVVKPHASPSVRRFARELGVDLSLVRGSGPKQRILHDDVREWVKGVVMQAGAPAAAAAPAGEGGAGLGLIPWPKVDFAKFGPIETRPVLRIRKISAANLHRNWVMIPHVTNHEDADVNELEAFRVQLNREHEKQGVKLTMLAFLVKACVAALKKF